MDLYFRIREGGWTARYRRKGLPDKEFITSNIKVADYAEKYLYRKSLSVEAGKYKQSSFDRIERTYNSHLRDTDAVKKTFSNLSADDIAATINAKKDTLSYSSLKKIFL